VPKVNAIVADASALGYELVYKTNADALIADPAGTALNHGDVIRVYRKHTATDCLSAEFLTVTAHVEAAPVAGTLTKTPITENVCVGANVSAVLANADGGNGTDELEYRVDGEGDW
jgi:hypothetical protein